LLLIFDFFYARTNVKITFKIKNDKTSKMPKIERDGERLKRPMSISGLW
jgi:hypothetical protein